MRILAFSDWRIQPLNILPGIFHDLEPDIILYGGDDLNRFFGLANEIIVKASNVTCSCQVNDNEIVPIGNCITENCLKVISHRILQSRNHSIPFSFGKYPFKYVNGNDDSKISIIDGNYFYRISSPFFIGGDKPPFIQVLRNQGEVITLYQPTIEDIQNAMVEDENGLMTLSRINLLGDDEKENGIYIPIPNPSFGSFTMNDYTGFGFECTFGIESEITGLFPEETHDVFLSHLPPKGLLDLSVRFGINHIGSNLLRDLVTEFEPRFVICGHSHFWGGIERTIGKSLILNVSSHDHGGAFGNYAIIDLDKDTVRWFKFTPPRRIRGTSYIRNKIKQNEPQPSEYENHDDYEEALENHLSKYDVERCNPDTFNEELDSISELGINVERLRWRYVSLQWDHPKVIRKITINPYKSTFVDVETGLFKGSTPGDVWLIGIWHQGKIIQFRIPQQADEFLNFIERNRIRSLVSWTRYDQKALRNSLRLTRPRYIDACQRTSNAVIWHTYQLHPLHNALFEKDWIEPISGAMAGIYADHMIIPDTSCNYCPDREIIANNIMDRNRDDILQMVEICRYLWEYPDDQLSDIRY